MNATARRSPKLLTYTAVLLMLAVAAVRGLSPFAEPDVWWHLRVGEHILTSHQLYGQDAWAGFADRPYLATQWLPEAVTAALVRGFGLGAVLWLRAIAVLGLTVVVYAAGRRVAGRLPAALATGAAVLGASASLNPRPQLVSLVLFAVTVLAWLGTARDGRPRWWLVPVFWLWACCHSLWMFGMLAGAIMSVCVVITAPGRRRDVALPLLALHGATLAAVALTPLGPRLLLAPFTVANNAAWIAEEWKATPVNNPFSIITLGILLVTVTLWIRRPVPRPLWQYAWLALAAVLTLVMWRLVPLGAILGAPLLASALQEVMTGQREEVSRRERGRLISALVAAVVAAGLMCLTSVGPRAFTYPSGMVSIDKALAAAPDRSVVMSDFGLSGWLLWRHPELVPAADLRMEIYPADYLRRYIAASAAKPGWPKFVTDIHARYALVGRTSPLGDAMTRQGHWHVLATSAEFMLLEAPGASS